MKHVLFYSFAFAIVFGIVYFFASMEAQTYNRLTGAEVTAWEALFVELRVDCRPNGK